MEKSGSGGEGPGGGGDSGGLTPAAPALGGGGSGGGGLAVTAPPATLPWPSLLLLVPWVTPTATATEADTCITTGGSSPQISHFVLESHGYLLSGRAEAHCLSSQQWRMQQELTTSTAAAVHSAILVLRLSPPATCPAARPASACESDRGVPCGRGGEGVSRCGKSAL